MKTYKFDAEIKRHPEINAAFIEFPYDVEEEFGTRGQVKVKVRFDGHFYRGSLAKMGYHCHLLGLTQKVRKAIGKDPGDSVHVVLKKDEEPRTVEIPSQLAGWLDNHPEEKEFFENLSYTNRKEYVRWLTNAKKEETRKRRMKKSFDLLKKRKKHP